MNIEQFLKQHCACADGAAFARKYASLADAWDACERPDWMLWAYCRVIKPDEKQLRLFACWCVRQIWDKLKDPRSRRAVEVAEAYAEGRATEEEINSAADAAADAAAAYAYATHSAAYCSDAAAAAAASASAYAAANTASNSSADAAYHAAAAEAAIDAVWSAKTAARTKARKAQASQLKRMIANPFRK